MVVQPVEDLTGPPPGRLSIIGCGNLARCDDGAGITVVRRLLEAGIQGPDVHILDAGTAGIDVMFQARGSTSLIIIDACSSESAPGSIFEVPGKELEQSHRPGLGLHDFRWTHALHAGRRIFADAFPDDVNVFLIEAAELGFGLELSPAVTEAVDIVTDRLRQRVDQWRRAEHAGEEP